jgi:hypothetical protein
MRRKILFIVLLLAVQAFSCPPARSLENSKSADSAESNDVLMDRIDFGNSYIRGQTIQSGAVYLLQRKKSDIESLLKPRESYREEILQDFYIREKQTEPTQVTDSK